jgi:branched-chain amino acid transport system substrate-binding protein
MAAIPIGGDGWTTQAFLTKGGNTIPRGYYLSHWSPELDRPQSRRFVATYSPLYALDSGMALAYDAVWLLADAIRRAQTSEPQAIRAALAATRNFSGVTGEISFAPHGDPVKSAVLIEILDGRPHLFQQVTPENSRP